MDPSIMELLQEDEDDETMHSAADVEAFTAALNRDIDGVVTSTSQPSDYSKLSVLSQGSGFTSNQFLPQWNPSTLNGSSTSQQETMIVVQQMQAEPIPSESVQQQEAVRESQKAPNESSKELHPFPPERKTLQDDSRQLQAQKNAPRLSQLEAIRDSGNVPVLNHGSDRTHGAGFESHLMKLQNTNSQPSAMSRIGNQQTKASAAGMSSKQPILPGANSQQAVTTGNINNLASGPSHSGDQVPFAKLLPVILPQLDKDRKMQLISIYNKLRRDEIRKVDFVRHMHSIVGNQMLKMSLYKLQTQNMPQLSAHSQASAQQWQSPTASNGNMNSSKPCDIERVPEGQADSPVYGSYTSNYQPFSGNNANASAGPLKLGPHDSQTRHIPACQNMNTSLSDMQNSFGNLNRLQGSSPYMTNSSSLPHSSVHWQSSSSKEQKSGTLTSQVNKPSEQHRGQVSATLGSDDRTPSSSVHAAQRNLIPGNLKDENVDMQYSRAGFSTSATISSQADAINLLNSRVTPAAPPVALGNTVKASSKKPLIGQKKPLEVLDSSLPPSSKKQKVSGAFLDQSIEQLNDVTAVSGVDLREEEEQLFSGPKDDNRVSEASRRVVQEEEERLILEKIPLQRKLAEMMAKSGLKGISNDVERCLSLCVEERIRALVGNLIRVSKQHFDIEKPQHKTLVTSDVGQQIMLMNKMARADWEKKQAEAQKLQKLNDGPEGNPGADGEKDKDEGHSRATKVNKEEDNKVRTTAANVAARAAAGGDDMLSKWQLMAEQARQKRKGDAASSSALISLKDNQQVSSKGQSTATSTHGLAKKVGKSQALVPLAKVARSISVKDVIAVLDREPQMSRSTLMYRLYQKAHIEAAVE